MSPHILIMRHNKSTKIIMKFLRRKQVKELVNWKGSGDSKEMSQRWTVQEKGNSAKILEKELIWHVGETEETNVGG